MKTYETVEVQMPCYEDIWGSEVQLHTFLTSTLERWVVSFMPWLLYPQGKSPHYFERRLGRPQSWSGCGDEKNTSPTLSGIKPWSTRL